MICSFSRARGWNMLKHYGAPLLDMKWHEWWNRETWYAAPIPMHQPDPSFISSISKWPKSLIGGGGDRWQSLLGNEGRAMRYHCRVFKALQNVLPKSQPKSNQTSSNYQLLKNCPDCNSGKSTTNGWSNRCRSKPALCRKCKDPPVPGNYIYTHTLLYSNDTKIVYINCIDMYTSTFQNWSGIGA